MSREGLGVGIFFLAAGVLFLLDAVELIDLRAEFLLPLLLIGFGIALIASGGRPARDDRYVEERRVEDRRLEERHVDEPEEQIPPTPPPPTPPPSDEEDEAP